MNEWKPNFGSDGSAAIYPGHEVNADPIDWAQSAVFQALGSASMCWDSPEKAGVFHSDEAKAIGDGLIAFLREHPL